MKILGLIGGTSWVSTVDYYKYINEGINERLGGIYYSRCIMHSFSYGEVKDLVDGGRKDELLRQFIAACNNMKDGGATAIVLCANTMHMFAEALEQATNMPVIHIATATAQAINDKGLKTVGLLGTLPTMTMDFYKQKLAAHGIATLVPAQDDMAYIHNTIFEELGKGIFTADTKQRYLHIMDELVAQGAEGIILGCTEIPMLLTQEDVNVPVFDTTRIHAAAAVAFSLG
ncbi:aspartate/glutamate racemase family protein [Nemorincola caseinilytica]|uniref:Aspartate/glutamate racemase family protein n=1 Tax=Nemorincola caseinilytica TaxID=2054315 RepID=A0ABP8N881_9BACT